MSLFYLTGIFFFFSSSFTSHDVISFLVRGGGEVAVTPQRTLLCACVCWVLDFGALNIVSVTGVALYLDVHSFEAAGTGDAMAAARVKLIQRRRFERLLCERVTCEVERRGEEEGRRQSKCFGIFQHFFYFMLRLSTPSRQEAPRFSPLG